MSGEALGWAKKQVCGGRGPKDVLKTLADYADANGFAYPSIATLASECEASERTVQRDLRYLEDQGLLQGFEVIDARTGRSRTRLYWFPMVGDQPSAKMRKAIEAERGARVTWVSPIQGDMGVTGEGDMGVTPGVTTVSPHKNLFLEPSEADASSAGARDLVEEAFQATLAAYPVTGLDNTNVPAARTQFVIEAEAVGDPMRLAVAAREFADALAAQDRKYPAPKLEDWLARQAYLGRLKVRADVKTSPSPGQARNRFADAKVRKAVVRELGEGWAVSWLDPCGWDQGKRVIDPRIKWRAVELGKTEHREVFAKLGVVIGQVGS